MSAYDNPMWSIRLPALGLISSVLTMVMTQVPKVT